MKREDFNEFDFSTLTMRRLSFLPLYKLPRTYTFGTPGVSCGLMPPGHPLYFFRHISTQYGNDGRNSPVVFMLRSRELVLVRSLKYRWNTPLEVIANGYYKPVPQKGLRFKLWEYRCYQFWNNCYQDENKGIFIPMRRPEPKSYVSVHDGRSYSANGPAQQRYEAEQAAKGHLITHENLYAVRYIQQWYPEYVYDRFMHASIKTARFWFDGAVREVDIDNHWWERFAEERQVDIDGLPKEISLEGVPGYE